MRRERHRWQRAPLGATGRDQAVAVIEAALARGQKALSEHQAKQVLAAYGIPVTEERLVQDAGELAGALGDLEFPVVLKIDSPDILHKTEAGLVALGCRTAAEAEAAFERISRDAREHFPEALINGVLVQEMVTGSVAECIVGMKKDPQFGPTILFGLGGIFVEVFEDVALRVAPLTPADAAGDDPGDQGVQAADRCARTPESGPGGHRGRAAEDVAAGARSRALPGGDRHQPAHGRPRTRRGDGRPRPSTR